MVIDDFGSVSIESIMDTVTRIYLGICVLGLAAAVAFPFYNNVNVRKNDVRTALNNYTMTYLGNICYNSTGYANYTGFPNYGSCPTPAVPLNITP